AREAQGHWVGIAANSHSGLGQGRDRVERLLRALQDRGLEGRVAWTPDERSELVAEARAHSGCRCLVAAGGDGTVAALVNERPEVPITVLKAGTENLFARHFGLSKRPLKLAATIATGRVVAMDLGQASGRRFSLMAGCGFDAEVVTRHHLSRIAGSGVARPTHRGTYVEPVLSASISYKFPPLEITFDSGETEETLVGTSAFLFNLPRYALGLPFAPSARGDDGWLDLVIFRNGGPWNALRYLWLVLLGSHLREPGVHHRRVKRVTIACPEAAPVQLDGDPGGTLAADPSGALWTAEILPLALEVLVPAAFAGEGRWKRGTGHG
ncbi:MAG TPA: diacylglycerol kinase family protein, partial [Isosphaeraceae bacterium]|nr:diacylglycerol kinase family protein [Isosphaeraceae bacterium]